MRLPDNTPGRGLYPGTTTQVPSGLTGDTSYSPAAHATWLFNVAAVPTAPTGQFQGTVAA